MSFSLSLFIHLIFIIQCALIFSQVDDIQRVSRFKEELGGLEATDKLGEDFIRKAVYNRKHMDKGYSVFDGGMDFLDACTKVNAFKAVALLKLGAEPNTLTPEDEPVLTMLLRKVRQEIL